MHLNPDAITWLFLDMNSFFASVEQQENKSYVGKPLIVVPSLTDATCAIAASSEAKAFGIKTGTNVGEAKAKCDGLICVPARHDVYLKYHDMMLECVVKHTPITKICSIDELASKLTTLNSTPEKATQIALAIKKDMSKLMGAAITCSIGLSSNRFLAKMAAELQKPDGLVLMPPRDAYKRLSPLKLTDLKGIGANMERRLNKAGIWTIEHLWKCGPKHLRHIWRSVEGEKFWYKLRGYNIPDLPTNVSVVGHSRVLEPRFRDPQSARLILSQLTEKACNRMRRKGYAAKTMSIGLRSITREKFATDISFSPPCQDNHRCVRDMHRLYDQLLSHHNPTRLKKVSVMFSNLIANESVHPDLFHDFAGQTPPSSKVEKPEKQTAFPAISHQGIYHRPYGAKISNRHIEVASVSPTMTMNQQQRHKDAMLSQSIDTIVKQFGSDSIHFGCTPEAKSKYVGTKIAFNRIPDQEEFW